MSPIFLAAQLTDRPSMGESLVFQFTGLVIVLTVLGGLWIGLELSGIYFRSRIPLAEKPAAPVPLPQPEGLDPVVLALIATAVHVTLGGSHRILSIKPPGSRTESQIWSVEGRREVFASHRTR